MAEKLIISKPGYNATTESTSDNLIFSSDYDTLKYYASGTIDLIISGADAETSVSHNLGYIPFFVAYVNYVPFETSYSTVPFNFAEIGVYYFVNAYATSTDIFFNVRTASANNTITFAYKIFRNNTGL